MDAELGEALAEGVGFERGALVVLEAIGESPLRHRGLEHLDGRLGGLRAGDAPGERISGVVVEDGEHVHADAPAVFEPHRKGALAVELPTLVGVVGFVTVATLACLAGAQPLDAAIGGMGAQMPGQCRAA